MDKRGGGLGAIWKQNVNLIPWDLEVPEGMEKLSKERQWYVLVAGKEKYAIMNVYLAFENQDNRKWNENLTRIMQKEAQEMTQEGYNIIIAGDLNAKIGNRFRGALRKNIPEVNFNGKLILALRDALGLRVANDWEKKETLITRKCIDGNGKEWSRSVLDYFLVDRGVRVDEFKIVNEGPGTTTSDHFMIKITVEVQKNWRKGKRAGRLPPYDLKRINEKTEKKFQRNLMNKLSTLTVKEFKELPQKVQIEILEEALLSAAKGAFPPIKPKPRISMGGKVRRLVKEKLAKWKEIKNGNMSRANLDEYHRLRRELKRVVGAAKMKKKTRKAVILAQEDPTREKFWRIYRSRKDREMDIQGFKTEDGEIYTDPGNMCKIAYEAFIKRLDGERQPVKLPEDELNNNYFEKEMMKPVLREELDDVISSFKNGKAGGPHFLRAELLKMMTRSAREYLRTWVNKVMKQGKVDNCLNEGIIKLIYKRGSKLDPLSYRPITLSCILGKLISR